MRDKIARAICARHCYEGSAGRDGTCADYGFECLNHLRYLPDADACLDALMKPTEGMIAAGEIVAVPDGSANFHRYDSVGARDAYRAQRFSQMIRAAKDGK